MTGKGLLGMMFTLFCLVGVSEPVSAQQFDVGDVVVSGQIPTGDPQIFRLKLLCYHPNGQLKTVLSDGYSFAFGRLAFSPQGVLYATSPQGIETVSPTGQITLGPYGPSFFRSLAFARDGSLVASGGQDIVRFSPSGALLNSYPLTNGPSVISLDVSGDQCTVYWLGASIRQFDICQGNQQPAPAMPSGSDFRLLHTGGIAISRMTAIEIYSASGTLVRTIPGPGGPLALDVDGTSIWLAESGSLSKFDIATGNLLVGPINTSLVGVSGLTVYGEPRAAFVNGALAGVPMLPRWMLLALCAILAMLAIVRLRI